MTGHPPIKPPRRVPPAHLAPAIVRGDPTALHPGCREFGHLWVSVGVRSWRSLWRLRYSHDRCARTGCGRRA